MAITPRLELRQGQTLTLTPQLQQAIKLLQLSNLELSEFIEAELENNPLLERDEANAADDARAEEPPAADNDALNGGVTAAEAPSDARALDTGEGFSDKDGDSEREDYDYSRSTLSGAGKGGNLKFEDMDDTFENGLAAPGMTLRDTVADQIQIDFTDAKERGIALLLLEQLDDAGYFRADLAPLAERLGCDTARMEAVLLRLQQLDPPGVFARNLRECLGLQLRDHNHLDPAMQVLLDNLDVLAAHDLKKLRGLCGVDDEDLRDMIAELKTLNPKPGLAFESFVAPTVVPDVLMRPLPKSKGGGWAVELNADTLPRVLINHSYYAEVHRGAVSKTDRAYLRDRMNAAHWLVKAMDQRAHTILKVAGELILQQEAFFNYGVEYLKPLTLRDIAAAIGMHESTVSRVTTGKYIGTPRGVFELKYFFTSGVANADGSAEFSSQAIKARLRALIDAERADAVLSDDDLVAALTREGIAIARRTVAKYREALKIPPSAQRRRIKAAAVAR